MPKSTPAAVKFAVTAGTRLTVALVVGIIAGFVTAIMGTPAAAPLVGWDAAALVYVLWTWAAVHGRDDKLTEHLASREDPSTAWTDLLLVVASLASLGAVGVVIASAQGSGKLASVSLALASVILSWLVVHLTYMLKYAKLYYAKPHGGVDFHGSARPNYTDFAYLAFTIGMTYQVSDTDISSHLIRRTALRHAILSYVFGAVILAATINLVVSLGS